MTTPFSSDAGAGSDSVFQVQAGVSSVDTGTGSETGIAFVPIFSSDVGTSDEEAGAPPESCIYCGHVMVYVRPGNPPGDAVTDINHFYDRPNVFRDYSLIDDPLIYGKFCPFAPPHPLGQFPTHKLPSPAGVISGLWQAASGSSTSRPSSSSGSTMTGVTSGSWRPWA